MRPPSRPAPSPRRAARPPRAPRPSAALACEPLEPRRLFAVDLITAAAGAPLTTGNGGTEFADLHGGSPTSSTVSDDGRFVAFGSRATNLVPGVTPDGSGDVYVRDRFTGVTTLLSTRADGQPGGESAAPAISGDGRFVAFVSTRALVAADANTHFDIYLRDRQSGTTTLVSRTPAGAAANGESSYASVSRNGRYVAFYSLATNILPGTGSVEGGLYRYDVQTGATEAIAWSTRDGGIVDAPQMSDDGNVVSYLNSSLGPDDETVVNAYVKNMQTGAVTLASVAASGAGAGGGDADQFEFELSGDGSKLAFVTGSPATPNDVNAHPDVFVRDLAAGTTTLVSVGPDGTSVADGGDVSGSFLSFFGGRSLSADGRFVVFESGEELTGVPDRGVDPKLDVYVRDLATNTTRLLSADPPGIDDEESFVSTVSADGRYAAFFSTSPARTLAAPALRVVEVATGAEVLVANRTPGGALFDVANGIESGAVFSRSGNALVFAGDGDATGLAPGLTDTNGSTDVFAVALEGGLPVDAQAPTAVVTLPPVAPLSPEYVFSIVWTDDVQMDPASVTTGDVRVTGPGRFSQVPTLVSATPSGNGTQVNAVYRLAAPAGVFDAAANGTYTIEIAANEIKDAAGNVTAAGPLPSGTFAVNISMPDVGPDLHATSLQGAVPPSVVAGASRPKTKRLLLTVTNAGNAPATGTVMLKLVASTDLVADPGDGVVAELPNQKVALVPGKSKVFRLKPTAFPAVADGDYRLLGVVDAGGAMAERLESNNTASYAAPVRIAAPFVDLGINGPKIAGRPRPGKGVTLLLTTTNGGNSDAKGTTPVRVRFVNPGDPATAIRTAEVPMKLNLKAQASRPNRLRLTLPADLPPGTYMVLIDLLPGGPWADPDPSDNSATVGTAFTV